MAICIPDPLATTLAVLVLVSSLRENSMFPGVPAVCFSVMMALPVNEVPKIGPVPTKVKSSVVWVRS
jgi:hypothetical protein